MGEIFKYIFKNLEKTQNGLVRQNKINRRFITIAWLTYGCLILTELRLNKQSKKIAELDKEIEGLKGHVKGE